MHFLIDANLPRSVSTLLAGYAHLSTDVRDIGMRSAPDPQIARYAKAHGRCILTGDFGFADIRVYPPADYHGIVVVGVPDVATPALILEVIKTLLDQPTIVTLLPGRLAIVEARRIRLRPPP